ncbi:unnamed protein product, partial [Prorocentrum cordatum]
PSTVGPPRSAPACPAPHQPRSAGSTRWAPPRQVGSRSRRPPATSTGPSQTAPSSAGGPGGEVGSQSSPLSTACRGPATSSGGHRQTSGSSAASRSTRSGPDGSAPATTAHVLPPPTSLSGMCGGAWTGGRCRPRWASERAARPCFSRVSGAACPPECRQPRSRSFATTGSLPAAAFSSGRAAGSAARWRTESSATRTGHSAVRRTLPGSPGAWPATAG